MVEPALHGSTAGRGLAERSQNRDQTVSDSWPFLSRRMVAPCRSSKCHSDLCASDKTQGAVGERTGCHDPQTSPSPCHCHRPRRCKSPSRRIDRFRRDPRAFRDRRSRNFLLHLTSPPRSDVLRAPLPPMEAQVSRCRSRALRQHRPRASAALIKILIVQNEYGEDESPSGPRRVKRCGPAMIADGLAACAA